MSKVVCIFSLPDEEEEFMELMRGQKYRWVLADVWNKLRSRIKHGVEVTSEQFEAYEDVRSWIVDACQAENLDIP